MSETPTPDAAKPSIGRIVWYQAGDQTYPALVVGAWQHPRDVELDDAWCAHLNVFEMRSSMHKTNVPYDATPVDGTWRWPEIVS